MQKETGFTNKRNRTYYPQPQPESICFRFIELLILLFNWIFIRMLFAWVAVVVSFMDGNSNALFYGGVGLLCCLTFFGFYRLKVTLFRYLQLSSLF
ncbi:hypothetical protein N8639_01790 [bacterium]|nr:hypothetical protein [bacterium]